MNGSILTAWSSMNAPCSLLPAQCVHITIHTGNMKILMLFPNIHFSKILTHFYYISSRQWQTFHKSHIQNALPCYAIMYHCNKHYLAYGVFTRST